jgi:hypothetical protein
VIVRFLSILLICLFAFPAAAGDEKPIVAVFPIEAKQVKIRRKTLEVLNVFLPARLAASGAFQIVPRRELSDRLRKQKKASYKLCYDQKCQIELGRELAAQKTLSTQILKIGKKCVVTSSLYDLKKAATERGATSEGKCSEEGLMTSVKNIVYQLYQKPEQEKKRSGVTMIETKGKSSTYPVDFNPKDFDALGFSKRAEKLAREKMPDAVLIDFDAEGVFPDGHVDLTLNREYRANYRFRSPKKSRGNPDLPSNVEQEIECLVYVEVSKDAVEVYKTVSMENCKEKPRPRWRCSLKQAWNLARKQGAPKGNVVAKVSWLWDGWYFDFGEDSLSVPDECQ